MFFYWYAAMQAFELGTQGVERWALGILVGKIKVIDSIGDTSQTTQEQAAKLLDVLNRMRSKHAVVVGEGDEIEVKETTGSGHNIALETVRFCYDSITRLITGSKLPSGGGSER